MGEDDDHRRKAKFIKDTHARLRKRFKRDGSWEEAWKEHVEDEDTLQHYADAMYGLATGHWSRPDAPESRTQWCRNVCVEYFFNGGLQKALEKDERRRRFHEEEGKGLPVTASIGENGNAIEPPVEGKLNLLDVGSCFNPFREFGEFLSLGIDIAPANEAVCKCDFLHVRVCCDVTVTMETLMNKKVDVIKQLPAESFHVVVFSLLLEYLPSPEPRWQCCIKASRLLRMNGLLLIVTPDSKHVNHNAAQMKSWRTAVESLGFRRWRYVKLKHLHCLAFRKTVERPTQEANAGDNLSQLMYIPQDCNGADAE